MFEWPRLRSQGDSVLAGLRTKSVVLSTLLIWICMHIWTFIVELSPVNNSGAGHINIFKCYAPEIASPHPITTWLSRARSLSQSHLSHSPWFPPYDVAVFLNAYSHRRMDMGGRRLFVNLGRFLEFYDAPHHFEQVRFFVAAKSRSHVLRWLRSLQWRNFQRDGTTAEFRVVEGMASSGQNCSLVISSGAVC